jgi:hypothetical protein
MSLVVTFNVSDLSARLTPSNQWEWNGPCKAEIPTDRLADRHWNADLTVEPISESGDHLRDLHVLMKINKQLAAQELEELSAAQTHGMADATIVWKCEEKTLGVTIGLRPQRYELFRTFVTLHFGRPDLIGRITTLGFVGFAATIGSGLIIPTYDEFLEGRPYLILGDSSIWFSAKPLA